MSDQYTYKIYPPLGVARVGNGPAQSETAVFTPEVPWQHLYDTGVEYLVTLGDLKALVQRVFAEGLGDAVNTVGLQVKEYVSESVVTELAGDHKSQLSIAIIESNLGKVISKQELERKLDDATLPQSIVNFSLLGLVEDVIVAVLADKYLGAVKKQAQRFYLYKCDMQGNPIEKVTLGDGEKVTWHVSVANKKAFWYDYNNALDLSLLSEGSGNLSKNVSLERLAPAQTAKRRNPNVLGNKLRQQLVIRSKGMVSSNQNDVVKLSGKFPANEADQESRLTNLLNMTERHNVLQGSISCSDSGVLSFYAGDGVSQAMTPSSLNTDFADNSNWYDDICDGSVSAELTLKNGNIVKINQENNSAWIATAPPDFAPQIEPLVTLYDMVSGSQFKEADLAGLKTQFSDVFPILYRLYRMQWVNQADFSDNQVNTVMGELSSQNQFAKLLDNGCATSELREEIFKQFRNPMFDEAVDKQDAGQTDSEWINTSRIIPSKDTTDIKGRKATHKLQLPFYPNDGVDYPGSPMQWFAIPPFMYQHLLNWSQGNFTVTDDEKSHADTIDSMAKFYIDTFADSSHPALLSARAALDALYGGGFHPGVELTWPMRHKHIYSENERKSGVNDQISLLGLSEFRLTQAANDLNMYQDFGHVIQVSDVEKSIIPDSDASWFWKNTPGDLTKWMGIPWQSDAASCQAVYTPEDFPIPAWWAANLPVHIVPLARYNKFKDGKNSDTETPNGFDHKIAQGMTEASFDQLRLEQYSQRLDWLHTADLGFVGYHAEGGYTNGLIQMVTQWKHMGMVMARPVEQGENTGIPEVVYVAYSKADKN
ncbi:LodA/GoxA family CTQ-dependent oxidase [Pseudoalteromonas sp. MMG013]|uniref:LodA/GoxA family CTQ-dependent oxidase n=1 Tax=Pseudoalteromonas sp. MMG013 TaxID=2822687 RepID=UPI001B38DDC6|nr:LodA/GoxA family CTQ-dependent oxidase [Pseudoalteromonas sp. MMG013]MBQ4864745.1 LodA/GoxA family CTQ-dependent oxidase [Pseudoalteromonas sp. MMG013]